MKCNAMTLVHTELEVAVLTSGCPGCMRTTHYRFVETLPQTPTEQFGRYKLCAGLRQALEHMQIRKVRELQRNETPR